MKKRTIFIYMLLAVVIGASIAVMRQELNYKQASWINGTPKLYNVSGTAVRAVFEVDSAAAIYWRVYRADAPEPKLSDFTNVNLDGFEGLTAYGGSFSQGSNNSYTNSADGLRPCTDYVLYGVAISYIGPFRGKIKRVPFRTKNG